MHHWASCIGQCPPRRGPTVQEADHEVGDDFKAVELFKLSGLSFLRHSQWDGYVSVRMAVQDAISSVNNSKKGGLAQIAE
jgi:hypothetical protein